MVPILFAATETAFTSNGLGRLADATKCEVTEERNGIYELVMEYPVSGKMYDQIACGKYIYATHDESKVPQAFQIYKMSTPLEGVVTINAWHISYALNTIIVEPFTAGNCAAAIAGVKTHSMNTNPFSFWTDKSVTADFETTLPMSARAILGGTQGSILDVYGKGEYEFDMFTVKLHLNRGQNRGVSIRYGKNLTQLDQTLDASNVYNSCVPYWTNGESTVVSDVIITKAGQTTGRTVTMDLSSEFDEQPTLAELKAKAQTKIDASDSYTLKENLKIDFVALWQTEEYKSLASLQRIYLCDTVNIFYAKAGINVTAQCIKVVYDSLRERYVAMELGEPNTSLIQQIQQEVVGDVMAQVPSKSQMQAAIDKATELISGGFGGYIKYHYLSDGTPSEILIMDSPDESTAVHIIRMNQNGIGFSSDGGSTYSSAWTIDGDFNASFIQSGILDADLIRAGLIQDTSGLNYWNLDTGDFHTQQGTIADFIIDSTQLVNGTVGLHSYGTIIKAGELAMSNWRPINVGSGTYENYTTKMVENHSGLSFTFYKDADSTMYILGGLSGEVNVSNGVVMPYLQVGRSSACMRIYAANSGWTGAPIIFSGKTNFGSQIICAGGIQLSGDITGGAYNAPVNYETYGNVTLKQTDSGDATVQANKFLVWGNADADPTPSVRFQLQGTSYIGGAIFMSHSIVSGTNKRALRRIRFQQNSTSSTTGDKLNNYEIFSLPDTDFDRTTNASYDIWTTKTIPEPPSTNGTYTLRATRTSSGVTYSWV